MTVSLVAGTACTGAYDFTISQLAQNQRVTSDQYYIKDSVLNSGSAFDISLAVGRLNQRVLPFTMPQQPRPKQLP